jgi:segregation and condensation protein A
MDEATADPVDPQVDPALDQAPEVEPQQEPARPVRPAPKMAATATEVDSSVCAVDLPEFEGPLDLLLHLVRRHELDILEIPISFVCEKYLAYIEFMRAMDLEVAGDYLVMAATLAYLKSRELVPSAPLEVEEVDVEEGPDPREELIARLLEYQTYREAAAQLDAMPISGRDIFGRGQSLELTGGDAGLAPITLFRLAESYHRVLDKARILKSHEVVFEKVSVSTRMQQLTTLLLERHSFDFEQIFLERTWQSEAELRGMLVVTLMSILELVRLGIARVHQPIGEITLMVERHASAQEAEQALAGYDEAASFGVDPEPFDDTPGETDEAGEDLDDATFDDDDGFDDADSAEFEPPAPASAPLASGSAMTQDGVDVPADGAGDDPSDDG